MHMGRGASLYELRDYQAAKVALDKSIQLDANIHFSRLYRGVTNHALKNKAEAISDLQIVLNLFEKDNMANMAQQTSEIMNNIRNA